MGGRVVFSMCDWSLTIFKLSLLFMPYACYDLVSLWFWWEWCESSRKWVQGYYIHEVSESDQCWCAEWHPSLLLFLLGILNRPDTWTMRRFTGRSTPCSTLFALSLIFFFLITKCVETFGRTLPSIRWHSKGSLCGSGPRDFRQLTKQLLLALDWLAAMLFRPTGKRQCESVGLNEVAWLSLHLVTC